MVAGYFTTDGGTEEEEISVNHLQLAKGDGGGVSNPPLTAALPSSPLPSPSRPLSIPSRPLPPPSPKRTPKSRFAVGCGDNG